MSECISNIIWEVVERPDHRSGDDLVPFILFRMTNLIDIANVTEQIDTK